MSRALWSCTPIARASLRYGAGVLELTPKCGPCEQHRTIVVKELLNLPDNYPEPWDYRAKSYKFYHALYDRTMKRFHKNSKLIVVEGNIGSGKSKVAEKIADLLGFHFMPAFKMDDVLVDRYGNDFRDYYHLFPKRFRIPDANLYYQNPADDLSAAFQDRMYFCRHEQYINALTHIVNTGQGVVLENSVYSDFVFANAMRAKDYISPEFFQHYYYIRRRSLKHLKLYPHLVIYLDVPVDKCIENIKNRGNTNEIAVCDEQYLNIIARSYKDCISELKRHSYILAYDCSKESVEVDTIIEDISKLDFDFFEWHSGDVMEGWFAVRDEAHWTHFRRYITGKTRLQTVAFENIRQHEVGELYVYPADAEHFVNVVKLEILKSYHTYGFTHKDSMLDAMLIVEEKQDLPEPWHEYFFRDLYYSNLHNINSLMDPYCHNFNPDYLKDHH